MRIVLTTSPKEGQITSDDKFEPMGILSLASFLKKYNYDVSLEDPILFELSIEELVNRILLKNPTLLGISIIGNNQVLKAIEVARKLRFEGFNGHICCGGVGASFVPEILLVNTPIDSLVKGEGEFALLDLVIALEQNLEWKNIKNISYCKSGKVVTNSFRELIPNLEALPFMSREFTNYVTKECNNMASIATGRGCVGRCVFCSTPQFYSLGKGKSVRQRKIESIIKEIVILKNQYAIDEFRFYDEQFIVPNKRGRNRTLQFIEELESLPFKISYSIMTRANNFDEKLIGKLKETGLHSICVGVESGNQTQLNDLNKGTTVKINEKAIGILKKVGIPDTRLGCILFEPFSQLWKIKESIKIFKKSDCFKPSKGMNRLQVLPGTLIEEKLISQNRLKGNPLDYHYDFIEIEVETLYEVVKCLFERFTTTEYLIDKLKRIHRTSENCLDRIILVEKKLSKELIDYLECWIKIIESDPNPSESLTTMIIDRYIGDIEKSSNNYERSLQIINKIEDLEKNKPFEMIDGSKLPIKEKTAS